eukprot:scaffold60988_cov20-Phaeocystis_antarctica.AAC.1
MPWLMPRAVRKAACLVRGSGSARFDMGGVQVLEPARLACASPNPNPNRLARVRPEGEQRVALPRTQLVRGRAGVRARGG